VENSLIRFNEGISAGYLYVLTEKAE